MDVMSIARLVFRLKHYRYLCFPTFFVQSNRISERRKYETKNTQKKKVWSDFSISLVSELYPFIASYDELGAP